MVIDLRKFNDWVGKKRGRPYEPKMLKQAIAQLDERSDGAIVILNSYNWAIHRIIISPVEFWQRENSFSTDNIPNPSELESPSYNGCPEASIEQQQQSIDRVA
jgi:hypothetical protein